MERTPEQEKDWLDHMQNEAIQDIQLELESTGIEVSEQGIIEEHEYRIHEEELEDSMIESNMS